MRSCCWVQYQQGRVILRLQDQITLGSLTFQCKGVGVGVETMKYEKFWEISKFHAGGDDKQFAWPYCVWRELWALPICGVGVNNVPP